MGIAGRPPRGIPGNSKSSGLIEIIKKTLKTQTKLPSGTYTLHFLRLTV